MSYIEINAHRDVYENTVLTRWAISQAEFRNAHFQNETPWIADDLLGRGDYAARKRQAQRDKLDVTMTNARLSTMRKGTPPPPGLHPVFIGEYHGGKPS